jgi:hypothetical protein
MHGDSREDVKGFPETSLSERDPADGSLGRESLAVEFTGFTIGVPYSWRLKGSKLAPGYFLAWKSASVKIYL